MPWKLPPHGRRKPHLALGGLDGRDGLAERRAEGEVERERDRRELALVGDGERRAARDEAREGVERHLGARGRLHVDALERIGILLEGGRDLEDDPVLVQRGEDRRDLALAEGVVEGLVDGLGQDAESRRGVAVDHERGHQPAVLLVGGHVAQRAQLPQLGEHARREAIEVGQVIALERVLVLGIAHAAADAQVLHGLQEQRGAGGRARAAAQAVDDLVGRGLRSPSGLSETNMRPAFVGFRSLP